MGRVFTLGICAMASKVESDSMQSILEYIASTGDFEIIIFPEKTILNEPITEWPIVECLIAFYSCKFPLEKAIEYVKRYKPIVLNDLEKQRIFRSRIDVYRELQTLRIPHPNYLVVDHEAVKAGLHTLEEHYDYIIYNNVRLNKPFIEKPVDSDDHNNWIYYPQNAGGGCIKLFRKIKDRSSKYCAHVHWIRRNGTFIYEEFMATFGTDIKVYTVGCMFAHAEARRSPSLDGKVARYADGKEVRYPVILSRQEKNIAYRIVHHFGQTVCGFDILRTVEGPYVCDINGWSFVKRNKKYHMDCSHILRLMFLLKLESKYTLSLQHLMPEKLVSGDNAATGATASTRALADGESQNPVLSKSFLDVTERFEKTVTEELTSVIVVMRHGDRKPKQKIKFTTKEPQIMKYFDNSNGSTEIKLKSPEELTEFARINGEILRGLYDLLKLEVPNSEISDSELRTITDALANHKELDHVLTLHQDFVGINRKVQLKAIYTDGSVDSCYAASDHNANGRARVNAINSPCELTKVLIVAKWGGELTRIGKALSEDLGRRLRQTLYPTDASGLIRLHSTFRHDLKIYSSDEGRCQITGAAFTKGLLDLDGELTPILVTMTIRDSKAHALLDDNVDVPQRKECRQRLNAILEAWDDKDLLERVAKTIPEGHHYISILKKINYSSNDVKILHEKMLQFSAAIKHEISKWLCLYSIDSYSNKVVDVLYDVNLRWKRLTNIFKVDGKYVFAKIPDILDSIRYDLINHHSYFSSGLDIAMQIYNMVQRLATVVSPAEYGVTPKEKLHIGIRVVHRLLQKILNDATSHRDSLDYSFNGLDDEQFQTDIYRNRDMLYSTLLAYNGSRNKSPHDVSKRLSHLLTASRDGSEHTSRATTCALGDANENQDGSEQGDKAADKPQASHSRSKSSVLARKSDRLSPEQPLDCNLKPLPMSVVAAASASAASVAATCLAVAAINDEYVGTSFKGTAKSDFIGGIKPSEMDVYSDDLTVDAIKRTLETNPKEPCLLNSTHLWVHNRPDPHLYPVKPYNEVSEDAGNADAAEPSYPPSTATRINQKANNGDSLNNLFMEERENMVQLEASGAKTLGIRSPTRRVRSRYYVTSASHLFSLFNFFKYAHLLDGNEGETVIRLPEGCDEDFHYLSHLVIRVWSREAPGGGGLLYRLEILVNMGSTDGFECNFDLLKQNANLLKLFYRSRIQRYNLAYVDRKVVCKSCGANIDCTSFKMQKPRIQRGASLRSLSLGSGSASGELVSIKTSSLHIVDGSINISGGTSGESVKLQGPEAGTAQSVSDSPQGRVYLCKHCCAGKSEFKYDANVKAMDTIFQDPISADASAKVPPYCELGQMFLANYNCQLSTLENYIKKALETVGQDSV